MLARTDTSAADRSIAFAALVVAAAGAATIAGALFFEHVLGLAPCPLCLQQRWPYYATIPPALLIAIGVARDAPRGLLALGLALIGLAMLAGAALGAYHAGVEWRWWQGPTDCAAASTFSGGSAGDLLKRMQTARVVRCDEAAWRDPVLKLSLAGWNVIISLALVGIAFSGVRAALRRD